ncbi:MAG: hypothetical protein ACTHMD_08990 [Flavisolibacter sp.]
MDQLVVVSRPEAIASRDETRIPLKRVLGVTTATLLVVSNVIGTGIFKKLSRWPQRGLNERWILGLVAMLGAFTIAGLIFANFLFFALMAAALIKMKMKRIITEKVPFYPAAPVLYIIFSLALLINTLISKTKLSLVGLCLICSGLPFYNFFKRKAFS